MNRESPLLETTALPMCQCIVAQKLCLKANCHRIFKIFNIPLKLIYFLHVKTQILV